MTPDEIKEKARTVVTRRFRLTVDVEVSVIDVPQAILESGVVLPSHSTMSKAEFVEFVRFQRRLLRAVVQDDEIFARYIEDHACSIAADFLGERYMTDESEILSSEEVVKAVLKQLPEPDQQIVREMMENGAVADNVEIGLFDPFVGDVLNFAVAEVEE